MTSIDGAVALVTGGQRGLGSAFVDALVAHGAAKVYATARTPTPSDDPRVVVETLDVTDTTSVDELAKRTGDVDIVINNAGVRVPGSLLEASPADVQATFATNVFGALYVAQTFVPILAGNGGGALVNIHSLFSWASGAGTYGASKAALWSLTNSLRLELTNQEIQVLGVHVGFVDTEMVATIERPKISPKPVAEKVMEAIISGQDEVLVDTIAARAKRALSGPAEHLALDHLHD